MTGIGGRPLIALSDLFKITQQFAIDQLDTGPLKPVLPVAPVIDWSVGAHHILRQVVACTAAGNPTLKTLDFSSAAGWEIMSDDPGWNGVIPGNFTATGPQLGIAVYVLAVWFTPADIANFTSAALTLTNAASANRSIVIWDCVAAGVSAGASPIIPATPRGPVPFCLSRFGPGQFFPEARFNVAVDQNVSVILETLTVPKGVYGRMQPPG